MTRAARQPAVLEAALVVENWVAEFEDLDEGVPVAAVAFMSDADGIKPLAVIGGVGGFTIADFAEGFLGVHEEHDETVDWGALANLRERTRRKEKQRGRKRRPRREPKQDDQDDDRDDQDDDRDR